MSSKSIPRLKMQGEVDLQIFFYCATFSEAGKKIIFSEEAEMNDFKKAVLTCLKIKYFDFNGRASRSEYWFFILFFVIASFVLNLIGSLISLSAGSVLATLLALALLLPSLGVAVRRLHDLNKCGWWLLIGLIPILGGLVLIFWFVQRGTVGQNLYGPDPLD